MHTSANPGGRSFYVYDLTRKKVGVNTYELKERYKARDAELSKDAGELDDESTRRFTASGYLGYLIVFTYDEIAQDILKQVERIPDVKETYKEKQARKKKELEEIRKQEEKDLKEHW